MAEMPELPNWEKLDYNTEQRLVIKSVSLHTQTGVFNLSIQVLNTRVHFIDIWYDSLTSVHYNLEYGLVITTESFSPLNLNYTISFVKVQIRSEATSHAIPDVMCTELGKTGLNWPQPTKAYADVMLRSMDS